MSWKLEITGTFPTGTKTALEAAVRTAIAPYAVISYPQTIAKFTDSNGQVWTFPSQYKPPTTPDAEVTSTPPITDGPLLAAQAQVAELQAQASTLQSSLASSVSASEASG